VFPDVLVEAPAFDLPEDLVELLARNGMEYEALAAEARRASRRPLGYPSRRPQAGAATPLA